VLLSQFPYDEFSKDFLEVLFQTVGSVQTAKSVASEVREIDLYFVPHFPLVLAPELGLLQRLATTAASFEPFRNPVSVEYIKSCLVKLLDLHGNITKAAKKNKLPTVSESQLPYLWIITPTLSAQKLQNLRAEVNLDICERGVYLLPPTLRTGIVVVHQLPANADTVWLRLMGRDKVQAVAAQEIAAMSPNNPYRGSVLNLLANLKIQIESQKKISSKDRQLIMNLSPLYLEQLSQAEQRGKAEMVIQQLKYRYRKSPSLELGALSPAIEQQVMSLNIEQIMALGNALLDFTVEQDLVTWLADLK
jgi:Domain of unknown function (DUF4351)